MPLVTVVVPTHNRAHLIGRALRSVFLQTFRDFELIVVDDASDDGTEDLVKGIDDSRMRSIRHESRRGASAARNTGIREARGRFVAFLDSDDEWLPSKLEKQLEVFSRSPDSVGAVYTALTIHRFVPRLAMEKQSGDISEKIFAGNFVGSTSTLMIKKPVFDEIGLFDEDLPGNEDWDLCIRIAQRYEFGYIAEPLVTYYFQPDSVSMNKRAIVDGFRAIERKHSQQIRELPRRIRAEHFFYLGKAYWWKRNVAAALSGFIRSFFTDTRIVPKIIKFFAVSGKRYLSRHLGGS